MNGAYDAYLAHYGVQGMKWGIRRYQNEDGSLTTAGRARYGKKVDKYRAKLLGKYNKQLIKAQKKGNVALQESIKRRMNNVNKMSEGDLLYEKKKIGTATKVAAVGGAAFNMAKSTPKIFRQAARIKDKYADAYIGDQPIMIQNNGKARVAAIAAMYSIAAVEGAVAVGGITNLVAKSATAKDRNRYFDKR